MTLDTGPFTHDYRPGAIHFGRGCIASIESVLAECGIENAMIVCGHNVGANEALMGPIREGLGDRLAGTFDETTPEKSIETAIEGVERADRLDADALIGVGAGSSLDTATVMSILQARPHSLAELRGEIAESGTMALPDDMDGLLPLVAVPTTFAGADLSTAAGTTATMDDGRVESAAVQHPALMPTALFYDPDLYETTPMGVLAGSAINGFDKAVETVYSSEANPITDATAVRSLRYLRTALPALRGAEDPRVIERAVLGIVLAQYGISRPGGSTINVVHAVGQGLRVEFGIQQGVAHAVAVPHVLRLLFEQVDGRRAVLAEGLVDGDPDDPASAVLEAVTAVRDGLELPSRLRTVEGTDEARLGDAARRIHENPLLERAPPAFEPTVEDVESALRAAW